MKPVIRIQLVDDSGQKFFGEGPCRLLRLVEETGSLRCAAASMEMAYSKALKLIKQAESSLGFPLTQRCAGGKDGGGPVCGTFTLWVNGKTTLDEEIQALEALDGVSYMTLM